MRFFIFDTSFILDSSQITKQPKTNYCLFSAVSILHTSLDYFAAFSAAIALSLFFTKNKDIHKATQ